MIAGAISDRTTRGTCTCLQGGIDGGPRGATVRRLYKSLLARTWAVGLRMFGFARSDLRCIEAVCSMAPFAQWAFSSDLLVSLAPSVILGVVLAWWVFTDATGRGLSRGRSAAWAVATAVFALVALPIYLLVGRPTRGAQAWGLGEVVGASIAAFLTISIAAVIVVTFDGESLLNLSIATIVQNLVLAAIVLYVVVGRYRLPVAAVGIRGRAALNLAGLGLGVGLLALPISVVAGWLAMVVAGRILGPVEAERLNDLEQASSPFAEILSGSVTPGEVTLILVLLCVIVPIGEELFFRGFVFGALRPLVEEAPAALLSAAVFAAVHFQLIHFMPIFVLGVVVAYAYSRTGSLLPAIIIHGVNNLVAVLATLYRWDL